MRQRDLRPAASRPDPRPGRGPDPASPWPAARTWPGSTAGG